MYFTCPIWIVGVSKHKTTFTVLSLIQKWSWFLFVNDEKTAEKKTIKMVFVYETFSNQRFVYLKAVTESPANKFHSS